MIKLENLEYVQPKPPKLWRMIGRKYWKGWVLKGFIRFEDGERHTFETPPAINSPNPVDVVYATIAAVDECMIKEYDSHEQS